MDVVAYCSASRQALYVGYDAALRRRGGPRDVRERRGVGRWVETSGTGKTETEKVQHARRLIKIQSPFGDVARRDVDGDIPTVTEVTMGYTYRRCNPEVGHWIWRGGLYDSGIPSGRRINRI